MKSFSYLYGDDMSIMIKEIDDINFTKCMLSSNFYMDDLRVADLILRIRILKSPQGPALSQSHYIERVFDKFKYLNFSVVKTPIDLSIIFQKNEGESHSQLKYAECWKF